jgi:hypothetical protein
MKKSSVSGAAAVSHIELMQLHVHTCYGHDDRGRLSRINEHDGGAAPRFWLGRTTEGVIWRFGLRFPDGLADEFSRLCRSEPIVDDPRVPPLNQSTYERLLSESAEPTVARSGPTYRLSDRSATASTAVEIGSSHAALLRGTLDDWIPDLEFRRPFYVSLSGSRAVAVCTSVRIGDRADEAGVETAPAHRRQGHAVNAVRGWSAALLASGKIPLYSTSWTNLASQAVARRAGFELFGTEYTIQ